MKEIKVTDITLRESGQLNSTGLSFKEKLEIARLLEKLSVDVIELERMTDKPADAALLRTLAATIRGSALSVPVSLDRIEIDRVWSSLSAAAHPRINIVLPTSTVQMEYFNHMKPKKALELVTDLVSYAVSLCPDVELTAEDATRSERSFLISVICAAIGAGAKTITLCDAAGESLPQELSAFIDEMYTSVPSLSDVVLGVQCRDSLGLSAATALSAVSAGASLLKGTFSGSSGFLSIGQFIQITRARGDALGVTTGLNAGEWQRICRQLEALTGANRGGHSAFGTTVGSATETEAESAALTSDADKLTVRRHITAMGYDVSDEDMEQIYYQFQALAGKKQVYNRDLEALVAETAHQVPPTYRLEDYVINSGSSITATACLRIDHNGSPIQAISIGDGPIDASFLAIEQALGHRYELEDFKIRAVTEGREALGDALVKLRSDGRLYSGHGLSTDIIGAAIRAYLSAVNKIVYEEKNA